MHPGLNYQSVYTPNSNAMQLHVNSNENGKGECVKEITARQKSRKQSKSTDGSPIQQEKHASGGELHLAPI